MHSDPILGKWGEGGGGSSVPILVKLDVSNRYLPLARYLSSAVIHHIGWIFARLASIIHIQWMVEIWRMTDIQLLADIISFICFLYSKSNSNDNSPDKAGKDPKTICRYLPVYIGLFVEMKKIDKARKVPTLLCHIHCRYI